MKNSKITALFSAARREPPVSPPATFAEDVLVAIRQQFRAPRPGRAEARALDALGSMFPRAAGVALLLIGLCVASHWYLEYSEPGDLAQAAEQWLEGE